MQREDYEGLEMDGAAFTAWAAVEGLRARGAPTHRKGEIIWNVEASHISYLISVGKSEGKRTFLTLLGAGEMRDLSYPVLE